MGPLIFFKKTWFLGLFWINNESMKGWRGDAGKYNYLDGVGVVVGRCWIKCVRSMGQAKEVISLGAVSLFFVACCVDVLLDVWRRDDPSRRRGRKQQMANRGLCSICGERGECGKEKWVACGLCVDGCLWLI